MDRGSLNSMLHRTDTPYTIVTGGATLVHLATSSNALSPLL